jgi:hypothetical protein
MFDVGGHATSAALLTGQILPARTIAMLVLGSVIVMLPRLLGASGEAAVTRRLRPVALALVPLALAISLRSWRTPASAPSSTSSSDADRAFSIARPLLPNVDVPSLDCRYELAADLPPDDDSLDLFRLLDVWGPHDPSPMPVMPALPPRPAGERLPDTLFVGSSFGWWMVREANRNHALGRTHFYYYNKTSYDSSDQEHPTPIRPFSPEWRRVTLSKSLYIVDMPEEYLVAHNDDFFRQIAQALTERP